MTININDRLLNVKEVATYLNVSKKAVYHWVKNGKIKYTKINGSIRFKPSDVEELVNG